MKKRDNAVSKSVPRKDLEQASVSSSAPPRAASTESQFPEPRVRWREATERGEMGGVIFVVGPPTDPRIRPGFDEYQAMRAAAGGDAAQGHPSQTSQWEAHERAGLSLFFDRKENQQSPMEDLLGVALHTEVRLTDYTLGFARFGDYWLTTVSIDFHQIEAAPGQVVLWPPERDVLEVMAALIAQALSRTAVRYLFFGQALSPCAPAPPPDEGRKRPAVELDPHAFFAALLSTRNLLTAFNQTVHIDQERLDLLAETDALTPLEAVFQDPDDNYLLFEGVDSGPPPEAIAELLGGTVEPILTFFFESGGPMCSTSTIFVAKGVCGYDLVFSRDEWQGYPLIGTLQAGVDDADQGLRCVVLGYIVNDESAGFPPSSIENYGRRLLSREDLGAALYHRLEQCNGWNDFEEQLELDVEFPILKPPEVLLKRALTHLSGASASARPEPDNDDADEKTGMTESRKLELLALYFTRGKWYRE